MFNPPRGLDEMPAYINGCDSIFGEGEGGEEGAARRRDEILDAVTFAVTCNPELGKKTDHPQILAWPTRPWGPDSPAVVIYYEVTEHTILLLDVVVADPNAVEPELGLPSLG